MGSPTASASRSAMGVADSSWPADVRQRPVASSHCQPCWWQVRIPVLAHAETAQVGLHVGAALLYVVAAHLDRAGLRPLLDVVALGVLQPLLGQGLEPGVDEVVVGAAPPRPEAHRQEQEVDPVRFVAPHAGLHEVTVDREAIAEVIDAGRLRAHGPGTEIDADALVADIQDDRVLDPGRDQVRLREQRLEPRLELRDEVQARADPGGVLGGQPRPHVGLVATEVSLAVTEDLRDLRVGYGMGDREVTRGQRSDAAGDHQPRVEPPLLRDVVKEDRLGGEDVVGIVVQVVELEQVVVQEARRAGRRDRDPRVHQLDVAIRPGQLGDALLVRQGHLRARRQVVHHGVPDGARELQEEDVDRPERQEMVGIGRPRVVHVEQTRLAVVDDQGRVADGAVRRGHERLDLEGQAIIGVDRSAVLGLQEAVEAQRLELLAQGIERVGRQDDRGVLVAVRRQPLRVEVVMVQVRHVEVGRVADRLGVDRVVPREGEPRGEERRVEPRVAQDGGTRRLDVQACLAQEGHTHVAGLSPVRATRRPSGRRPVAGRRAPSSGDARRPKDPRPPAGCARSHQPLDGRPTEAHRLPPDDPDSISAEG